MEGVPFKAGNLSALLLISPHTLPPQFMLLVRVLLASAAFDHGVEFPFDHLAACYLHLEAPPISLVLTYCLSCCGRSAWDRSPKRFQICWQCRHCWQRPHC